MFQVPDANFYRDQRSRLADARTRLLARQGEAISRRRLNTCDDNPTEAALALNLRERLDRAKADRLGVQQLIMEYDTIDLLLGDATEALAEARRCAVGARTATQSTSAVQRQIWQREAQSLLQRVFQAANGRVGDRFAFAGTLDHAPPFDLTGTYTGNALVREVEVDLGITFPANLPGSQVFNVAGGENVIGLLSTLATDVGNGVWAPTGNDIDRLRNAQAQVSLQRTAFGEQRKTLDQIRLRIQRQEEIHRSVLADLVEVDEVTSATQLRAAETDYERGIKSTADLLRTLEIGL